MNTHYKLVGKQAVPCTLLEWAEWMQGAGDMVRRVAHDHIGPLAVSTMFLGVDHRLFGTGPPLLFETMIFDGGEDGYQERCTTWDQAEEQHAKAVAHAREQLARAKASLEGSGDNE